MTAKKKGYNDVIPYSKYDRTPAWKFLKPGDGWVFIFEKPHGLSEGSYYTSSFNGKFRINKVHNETSCYGVFQEFVK